METNLFGKQYQLDDRGVERIQIYFDEYIKKDESLSDERVLELVSLVPKTSIIELYENHGVNYMFLMKAAMEVSKEESIILNASLKDAEKLSMFMDMNGLLYSRLFTEHFTLTDDATKISVSPSDVSYLDFVVRFIASCLISNNKTKIFTENEEYVLRDLVKGENDLLVIMTKLDQLFNHFRVNQINIDALDNILYEWLDDKRNFDKIIQMFRIFVPVENETPGRVKTPTMMMSDKIINAFVASHRDIAVNYLMNAIIIQNMFNLDEIVTKAGLTESSIDDMILEGFDEITEHLNSLTDALTIRGESFDITKLGLSPYYICDLFKKYSLNRKTGLRVIDLSETGIYDLLTIVINSRAYIEFLEIINSFIDVAAAINSGMSTISDISILAYVYIELNMPLSGKIDFAITNDPELHIFRYNDRVKFGIEEMTIDEFLSNPMIEAMKTTMSDGTLYQTYVYSEDIRDIVTISRFINRNI